VNTEAASVVCSSVCLFLGKLTKQLYIDFHKEHAQFIREIHLGYQTVTLDFNWTVIFVAIMPVAMFRLYTECYYVVL